MQARAELQQTVKAALDEATSSKSPYAMLSKKLSAVERQKLAILDLDPDKVLADLRDKVVEPLKQLHASMATAHLRDLDQKRVAHARDSTGLDRDSTKGRRGLRIQTLSLAF